MSVFVVEGAFARDLVLFSIEIDIVWYTLGDISTQLRYKRYLCHMHNYASQETEQKIDLSMGDISESITSALA